jgi:hypothetical protein
MTSLSIDQFQILQAEPHMQTLVRTYLEKVLVPVWSKLPLTLRHKHLFPLVWSIPNEEKSSQITLYCLGAFQNRFFKYFYEYCTRICEPHTGDPISLSAIDFIIHFKDDPQRLTLCQITFDLPNASQIKTIEKRLLKSSSYLKLGQMTLLLETPSESDKESWEEDHRQKLYELLSQIFSKASFIKQTLVTAKLQQLLASTPRPFFYERSPKHIVDLAIQMAYFQTKALGIEKSARRRAWVHHRSRWILDFKRPQKIECWVLTLNFLKANEVLEERHFLQVLRSLIPGLQRLSFFTSFKDPESRLIHYYFEVDSNQFVGNRKRLPSLKSWLAQEVLRRIERKPLAVFTARNEEESIKWLTTLSKELTSKHDIPQMALLYHNQNDDKILFHLLSARACQEDTPSLQTLLKTGSFEYETHFQFDKTRKIEGAFFTKELCLVEVEVSKSPFLRDDFSVNIQKARHWLLRELQSLLGALRDFNGGLMAKQQEIFEILEAKIIASPLRTNLIFFEDLFFNLQPAPMISSFEPTLLLNWLSGFVQKRAQSSKTQGVERLLFEQKNQACGLWFIGLNQQQLDLLRHRINDSLRYEHELVWTQGRNAKPYILGCLVKTGNNNHKSIFHEIQQMLPRSTKKKIHFKKAPSE